MSDPLDVLFVSGDELKKKIASGELLDPTKPTSRAAYALRKEIHLAQRQLARYEELAQRCRDDIAAMQAKIA